MITFNGIPIIQVPDLGGAGCEACCFNTNTGGGCMMARMDEWTGEAEREQFGGDCAENRAHYELDQ